MDQILNWRLKFTFLALCATLASCGGGGGSTVVPSDTASTSPSGSGPFVPNPMPPDAVTSGAFSATWVMGSPTADAITFNVHSADQQGAVSIEYGANSLQYDQQTGPVQLQMDKPLEMILTNLKAGTRYFYRLRFQASNNKEVVVTPEYEFQTAKSAGQAFVFAIQGDSHPERLKTQFDADLYKRTLLRAAADKPDFYILSGDDFSVDTLNPDTITSAQVRERYTLQSP